MISDALIAVLAFSGLLVGIVLARFCREEIEPGKKYLVPLKVALMVLLGLGLLAATYMHYTFFIMGCLVGYVFKKPYFYLGLAMASAIGMPLKMVMFVSSLVFSYGLPEGSLLSAWKKEVVFSALLFSIPFALLFADFEMVQFLSFAAGGILINPFAEAIENFINIAPLYKKQ